MPRLIRPGKCQKSGTNDAALAAAKAASDAAFASTGVNPAPMGRPWPTREAAAAPEQLSPAHSSEKRAADMALGKDAGLISSRRDGQTLYYSLVKDSSEVLEGIFGRLKENKKVA